MPKITETKLKAEIKELIELIKLIPTLSNPLSQLDCISLSPSEDLNSINSLYQAIAYYWECYLNNEEKSISFDSSKNKNEIVIKGIYSHIKNSNLSKLCMCFSSNLCYIIFI